MDVSGVDNNTGSAMPPGPPPIDISSFPPEYVNASNASRIVGLVGAFHVLAFVFVSLRLYVRFFMVRAFGVDDGLIIIAYLLALMSWICLILQVPYGLGRHGYVVPVEDRIKMEHITFWKAVFSDGVALGVLRISMAISLLRLKKDLKWYRYSLFAVIAFIVAYSIQAIAWLFIYCTPYSGWWEFQWMNPFDPRCHDFNLFLALTYWNIACNIFTDVVLGALPVPIIWKLRLKLRVKLYVIGILNLGYLAVLCGILKAVFMLTTGGDPDHIFDYWVHVFENLQLNIGIVAACASFLKPLVGRLLRLNSTAAGYSSYPGNQRYYRGRTPMGTETIGGGGGYARKSRRGGTTTGTEPGGETTMAIDDNDFEMSDKAPSDSPTGEPRKNQRRLSNHIHGAYRSDSPVAAVITQVEASHENTRGHSRTQSQQRMQQQHHQQQYFESSSDALPRTPTDADSEEIILQRQEPVRVRNGNGPNGGILISRDVSVRYSPR